MRKIRTYGSVVGPAWETGSAYPIIEGFDFIGKDEGLN